MHACALLSCSTCAFELQMKQSYARQEKHQPHLVLYDSYALAVTFGKDVVK